MAEFLIAKGADINAKGPFGGNTPLTLAIDQGDQDTIKLLIYKGADVNARMDSGQTALHWCCFYGQSHKDKAEVLIANGADINAKDNEGRTPLWWAKDRGNKQMVELLLKHGAKE
jgi:ankyrin repeat protein